MFHWMKRLLSNNTQSNSASSVSPATGSLGKARHLHTLSHDSEVMCLDISADGKLLAVGAFKTIRVWNLKDGKSPFALPVPAEAVHVSAVRFSANSDCIVAIGEGKVGEGTGCFWRLVDKRQVRLPSAPPGPLTSLAVSSDGCYAACGSAAGVGVWSLPGGTLLKTFSLENGHLVFSPDSKLLVADESRNVIFISLPDGGVLKQFPVASKIINDLTVSADGQLLVSGAWDKAIRLWSIPDGHSVGCIEGLDEPPETLAITPDSRVLVGGFGKSIRLWSVPDCKRLTTIGGYQETVRDICIRGDSKLLAIRSGEIVELRRIPDGELLESLKYKSGFNCLGFTPDGRTLATRSDRQTIDLWDVSEVG